MFKNDDLGASLYKTWNNTQRRDEIARLVEGYRNGLPAGILCKLTETIAGSRSKGRKYLRELLTPEERQAALEKETGGMLEVLKEFMR
jgi:hypothetical protein